MPLNRRMDKENMVYLHNGVLLSGTNKQTKSNDISKFAGQCMELEKTILNEVIQTQRDKYGMCLLISGY